jgi:tryptophan halogenase
VVKFRSGRYRRAWVDNVCAIGNSCGFVEPLEATSLMVICSQCKALVQCLQDTALSPTPTVRKLYNHLLGEIWDEIRDFLALHYKLNTMLDTPFWRQCRAETDVSAIGELLEFYEENGPMGFARHLRRATPNSFEIEGFLLMLVGNNAPYRARHRATAAEREIWNRHRAEFAEQAAAGMDVREALAVVRLPEWRWFGESAG